MTALVGPSGEGKSTCVSLLERFYEQQSGEILLDNEPLKSYDHRFLHKKVINRAVFVVYTYTINIQQSYGKKHIVNEEEMAILAYLDQNVVHVVQWWA